MGRIAWSTLVVAALVGAGCSSSSDVCRSAAEHAAECIEAYCAGAPTGAGAEMCTVAAHGSAFAGECTAELADQADDLLSQSCDEIVGEAISAGKADVPCPWYFPWCGALVAEDAGYTVHLLAADSDHLTLQIDLDRVARETVTVDGRPFDEITIAGASTTSEEGRPALPVIGLLVGLPWDTLAVDVDPPIPVVSEVWDGATPVPFRRLARDMEEPEPYRIDAASYADYQSYPRVPITVGQTGVWRDYRVVRLEVAPVSAVTGLDQVTVARSMIVEVRFVRPGNASDDTPSVPGTGTDADEAYEGGLVNYDTAPPRPETDQPPLDYLVIVADPLRDALTPWLDFKEGAGLDVQVVLTSEIGETPDATSIRDRIAQIYQQRRPQYVLLVGDTKQIPQYHYAASSYWSSATPSDSYYSFLEGDDLLADVALGRLFARTPEELTTVIDKTLAYQRGDRRAPWRGRFVAVAHKENAPEKYTGCVKSIVDRDYGRTIDWVTLLGADGATNDQLTEAINEGAGVVSYRGHGSTDQWEAWGEGGVYKLTERELTNGEMTPVVFSIACLTSHIETENSLAEQFFLRPNGGAVAYLGATEPSYTKPNHDFNRYLFAAMLDRNVHRIGALAMQANAALLRQYGDDTSTRDNVQMYFWLGDPSIEVGVPYHCAGAGADAGPDLSITEGETVTLGAPAESGKQYTWTPADGLSCADCAQPEATPQATTTYVLVAHNDCSRVEDQVTVTVTPAPTPDAGVEPDAGPLPEPDAGIPSESDAGVPEADAGPQ